MNWKQAMDLTYWQNQTPDKPLFPDIEWGICKNSVDAVRGDSRKDLQTVALEQST